MGAGEFKHLHGTLEAHLLGTEALLAAWGAPDHVRTAGLFHAAYGTAGFKVMRELPDMFGVPNVLMVKPLTD